MWLRGNRIVFVCTASQGLSSWRCDSCPPLTVLRCRRMEIWLSVVSFKTVCKIVVKMRPLSQQSFRVKQDVCELTRHYISDSWMLLYPFWFQVKWVSWKTLDLMLSMLSWINHCLQTRKIPNCFWKPGTSTKSCVCVDMTTARPSREYWNLTTQVIPFKNLPKT